MQCECACVAARLLGEERQCSLCLGFFVVDVELVRALLYIERARGVADRCKISLLIHRHLQPHRGVGIGIPLIEGRREWLTVSVEESHADVWLVLYLLIPCHEKVTCFPCYM